MPHSGFEIRHELADDQIDQLVDLYRGTWWADDRTRSDVERMLEASDVVVAIFDTASELVVAFSRALTDETYFAMVFDVIIAPAWRERGLGRQLMDAVVAHPRLARVQSLELVCQPELVGFYRQWGFDDRVGTSTLMRRAGQGS